MSKNMNVPKLRFSEFGGEWEEKKLGSLGEFKGGGTPSKQNDEYWMGTIPWISSSDINENDINTIKISRFINEKSIKESATKIIPKMSILFVSRVGVGKLAVNRDELCTSQDFTNFIPTYTNSYYLGYLFQSKKSILESFNQGTSIKGFTKNDIETLKIKLPSKQEQEKIASFLISVDTKIEQLSKKDELLESYKKGVMQKIFSQKIRFKADDGSEFPEWEEKKLGDITEIIMGQSPNSNSYNLDNNGIPLIQGNTDIQNRLTNPRNYTTEKTKECKVEDLILTVRAPVGAVAKSIHNACIGRGVCAIRNNKKSVNEFIYQFLLNYETKWSSIEQGSTFTAVSSLEIKKLKLNLPSLKEQTKIANFLSSIDIKLSQNRKAQDVIKKFKKALLQQMFV